MGVLYMVYPECSTGSVPHVPPGVPSTCSVDGVLALSFPEVFRTYLNRCNLHLAVHGAFCTRGSARSVRYTWLCPKRSVHMALPGPFCTRGYFWSTLQEAPAVVVYTGL